MRYVSVTLSSSLTRYLIFLFTHLCIFLNSSFTTGRTLKRQCPLNPKTIQTAFDESGSDEEDIQILKSAISYHMYPVLWSHYSP